MSNFTVIFWGEITDHTASVEATSNLIQLLTADQPSGVNLRRRSRITFEPNLEGEKDGTEADRDTARTVNSLFLSDAQKPKRKNGTDSGGNLRVYLLLFLHL